MLKLFMAHMFYQVCFKIMVNLQILQIFYVVNVCFQCWASFQLDYIIKQWLQIFLPLIFNNHVANHEFTSCIHLQQLAWVLDHNKFKMQDIKTYIYIFPYTFLHLCKMLHFFIVHIWFVQARSLKIEIIYQDNIEGKLCHSV